jgi:hypothetical protein
MRAIQTYHTRESEDAGEAAQRDYSHDTLAG